MTADINTFSSVYLERITQLTNKVNQFNLTTKRYTNGEINKCHIDLWLMSCRIINRGMEFSMPRGELIDYLYYQ